MPSAKRSQPVDAQRELEAMRASLETRTRDLALAAEIGRRISLVRDLESLLAEAVELIRSRFDLYYTQIYLTHPEENKLVLHTGTGPVGAELLRRGHALPLGPGSINGMAAAERRAIIVADTATSRVFYPNPLLLETRSEMAVPLMVGERVVGVLDLQSARPGALADENLPAFEALAGQLAVAIENSALFAQARQAQAELDARVQTRTAELARANTTLRRQKDYLAALHETALGLIQRREVNDLLEAVITRAAALVKSSDGYLYLLEPGGETMRMVLSIGSLAAMAGQRIRPDEGLSGRVWRSGQPLVVNNYADWPGRLVGGTAERVRAVVGVPLKSAEAVVGVIGLAYLGEGQQFDEGEVELLMQFAELASIVLDNARLYQAVQDELAERKKAEVRLRLSDEILQRVRALILVADERSQIVYVGRAIRELLGYEPGELLGEGWWRVSRSEAADREREQEYVARAARGELPISDEPYERVVRARDGQPHSILWQDALGPNRLLIGVGHDITERKRAEAALRESEARYRRQALYLQLAADVAGVATSSLDLEQVLLRVTTLLCERFGYYYVAIFLLDESGAWAVLQASSGGARARPVEAGQRLERGGPTFVGYVTQTGQPRVSQSVGADAAFLFDTLMPGTQAEAVIPLLVGGMVIGALDVHSATPHVFEPEVVSILTTLAGQIAIAVQNARLHAAQKARALELEQAYHALQENQARLLLSEKLASLGRLTAGIAHEMNSPLAAVRATLAQLSALVTEYQASLDDAHVTVDDHREIGREMREALRLAQQGAERAAAFVRSIKVQTRETGPLQPERFNAVDLVNETLLLLHHPLRQGGCAVTFEPGSDYVALHGSPGRLALAVTNLVTNAIEASATKGGGLIQLVLAAQAEGVSLRVSDQGSGIPADVQPRIFDPMFSTKPFGQSTGMGLTVVHNIIVGEFGGTIEVESLPGQGATFTLHFPHPPSPRADPAVPETRPESGDDERPT